MNFSFEFNDDYTKIINNSEYNMYVSLKPKLPKRKVHDIFVIRPNGYHIYEFRLSIHELYFSFQQSQEFTDEEEATD